MSLDLPIPIAAYFAAGDGAAGCFTETAVVKDEGHTYNGRDAIAAWKTAASAKYNYTSEPIAVEGKDGKFVVTGHVVGDFPGSPVDLRFFFVIEGDRIASLEIVP